MVFSTEECGIMLEPQLGMSMETLIDSSKLAESLGFGYLFRSDHLLPTNDERGKSSQECWTSLGAIAASTSRIKFGPLVTPIGFRNPALLAKMACTLHSFSHGRLQLAVGAGWYEPEYKALGYEFPGFGTRVAQFREALEIMATMIGSGKVDYDGKYFSAHTDCYPRPDGHLNLIVGGRTKPVVRLAGTFADEWNSFRLSKPEVAGLAQTLTTASGGRKVALTEMTSYLIGKTTGDLEKSAGMLASRLGQDISPGEYISRLRARDAPCGTVDDFVSQLRGRADLGFERIYFQTLNPDDTAMIELLADTLRSGI
jgi:alkanesulfonate monooxygenase SsuD/methylene tetrahydromethanopterin reductase-like flavin-dependent oxidoreductase (luciferase family)